MPVRPLRILLIDDDEDSFILTRALLAQPGMPPCRLDWSPNYQDGLQRILNAEHDAHLIDYRLGAENGLDLVKEAIHQGCRAPLILLTGQNDRAVDLEAMQAGAADYLIKGQIDAAGLERSIRYALERARREQVEASLRDSDALYHSLVDSLPVCVLRKDLEGRFTFANRAYCDFTGRVAADILGKTDFYFSPRSVAERFQHDDQTVRDTGRPLREIEVNETDGQTTWVEVIKTPVCNAQGRIIGTQAIFWDVTERQKAVEALRRAKEAAESANRAKSDFLANMSHEIRTPLNAVLGMTELVLDSELKSEQREYLTMVRDSGELLLALINDILDFSKIEAGKLDLEAVPFPLAEILGDTMKALATRAQEKGLELACHIAPQVPAVLVGDPNRLRQIVVNLVGNAIKFTETGEVVLDVQPEACNDEHCDLHFRVIDTGIGIEQDKLPRLFRAFEQGDASTTRKYGGTGLGLAISSRLLHLMGGRIWAESQPGHGSQFHFTVPLARHRDGVPLCRPRDLASLRGMRVLVVDDNQTNRLILDEMLRGWGLQPTLVDSAQRAMDQLREAYLAKTAFPLLITDCNMPGRDGFQLAEQVRQDQRLAATVIMMLTSGNRPEHRQWCKKLGIAAYLMKPIKQSELLEAVGLAMGRQVSRRTQRGLAEKNELASLGALRFLLAEDSVVNQKLAIGLLQRQGHAVTVANNGKQAISLWESAPFDVVLMDVQMPEMDGLEATAAIRAREQATGRHAPIVAMTAHALKGDRERCLAAGMDEYVSKPIQSHELFLALCRVLAGRGAARVDVPQSTAAIEAPPPSSSTSVINWQIALAAVQQDRQLLAVLAETELEESASLLRQMQTAIRDRDSASLKRAAHTLKSHSRLFGAAVAEHLAQHLENATVDGSQDVGDAFSRLQQQVLQIQVELREFLERGSPPDEAENAAAAPSRLNERTCYDHQDSDCR